MTAPAARSPAEDLRAIAFCLERALELVRAEVRRTPLLRLTAELRPLVAGDRLEDSAALSALRKLLEELRLLDDDGWWGHAFALRDRFRLAIAAGVSSKGMDHRDWGLWWALAEELNRVEALEAVVAD